jgi:hypothetical protein
MTWPIALLRLVVVLAVLIVAPIVPALAQAPEDVHAPSAQHQHRPPQRCLSSFWPVGLEAGVATRRDTDVCDHWPDSSHITFILLTTSGYDRRWKAEVSLLNGRELPDEDRADFDFGPLNSVSGRPTFMPTARLALEVSAGHLHGAEAEFPPQPRSDVERGHRIGNLTTA